MWIYTPKKVQQLAQFTAADPWNGGQRVQFHLDRCFSRGFVPDYSAYDDESLPSKFAIRSELDKAHRVLPDSLASLWRSGKVTPERLPALLRGLEPNLKRSDFIRLLSMNKMQRGIRTYAGPSFGGFLLVLGMALLLDKELAATGAGMIAVGVLLAAVTVRIMRRLNARRKEQTDWALSQSPV